MASRRSLLSLLTRSTKLTSNPQQWTTQSSLLDTGHFSPKTQLRPGSTNSTSALAYKALHRRSPLPLPVSDAIPNYGAAAAVSSILYETPVMSKAPPKKHILNCLVQNEPGVLSRISGILAARGFNIDSLVVCNTEVEDLSRMTIVLRGLDGVVEQARRQLEDLVPVWAVLDYTSAALVQRELLLAKVSIMGPEVYEELMEHHREMTAEGQGEEEGIAEENAEQRLQELESQQQQQMQPGDEKNGIIQRAKEALGQGADYHPSRLAASQALRHKHEHLEAITHLTHQFGGKVLDISTNNCIVEV
jgi:acetolactate synthase I/III small subunit